MQRPSTSIAASSLGRPRARSTASLTESKRLSNAPASDEPPNITSSIQSSDGILTAAALATTDLRGRPRAFQTKRELWALTIVKFTALFELALTFIHYIATPNMFDSNPPDDEYSLAIIMTLFALVLPVLANIWSTWVMVKRFQTHYVPPSILIIMYMGTIFSFAGLYYLCFLVYPNSMSISGVNTLLPWDEPTNSTRQIEDPPIAIMLNMVYFSITTMSTTGFGDVLTFKWYTELINAAQIFLTMAYSVGFFAMGTSHFQEHGFKTYLQQQQASVRRCCPWWYTCGHGICTLSIVKRVRKLIMDYILIWTIIIQLLCVLAVDLASGGGSVFVRTEQEIGTAILSCLFQVINLALICYVSFQLVLKIENDVTKLRKGFIAQSLVATVVNFGGIYFMMFLFQGPHSFLLSTLAEADADNAYKVGCRFFYLSAVTFSSVGFGDLTAVTVGGRMMVGIEMLASQFYTVVIVGLGLAQLATVIQTPSASPLGSFAIGSSEGRQPSPLQSIRIALSKRSNANATGPSIVTASPMLPSKALTLSTSGSSSNRVSGGGGSGGDTPTGERLTSSTIGAMSPSASERAAARDALPFPGVAPPHTHQQLSSSPSQLRATTTTISPTHLADNNDPLTEPMIFTSSTPPPSSPTITSSPVSVSAPVPPLEAEGVVVSLPIASSISISPSTLTASMTLPSDLP